MKRKRKKERRMKKGKELPPLTESNLYFRSTGLASDGERWE